VSIIPKTTAEALRLIDKAEDAQADLIEVRLDCLKDYSALGEVAAHGKAPKIATCKLSGCGGKFSGTETEQLQLLLSAAKNGFEYVDIELTHPRLEEAVKELKLLNVKPIVSFHDFAETPSAEELDSVLEREIAGGTDVCKIVTTAKRIEDNLVLLDFTLTARNKAKIVCFAMGKLGRLSRLLSPLFGGYFTFASLERGSETAAGQMAIQEMRRAYDLFGA
jgi:3-dehydroquinate dehydratase type I